MKSEASEYGIEKRKRKPAPRLDRLPPHSEEAERAVLGAILGGTPEEIGRGLNECEERGVTAEWFYDLRHQTIYWAMSDAHKRGVDVDMVVVHQWLADSNRLEQVGGTAYVSALPDMAVPSQLGEYLDIVEDKWQRRRLLKVCADTVARVWEEAPTGELVAETEKGVLSLAEDAVGEKEKGIKPLLQAVVDKMDKYHRGVPQTEGITTGLAYLDKMLLGIGGDRNNMVVVAGRPGTGKTMLALNVASYAALDFVHWVPDPEGGVNEAGEPKMLKKQGVPVAIFSLEMTAEALAERMLFQRAKADAQRWRTGQARSGDVSRLLKAASELAKAPIVIDDSGRETIDKIRAKARRMHRQYGIRLFVVDYVQLLSAGGKRFRDDRVQELAEISGELQKLGKELRVPFIILAQMNRDYEKDHNRVPRLSDLKDCGAIEQDADIVGFLYSPKKAEEDEKWLKAESMGVIETDWTRPWRVNLLVAKSRNGPTGDAEMLFHKHCGHFDDWWEFCKEKGVVGYAQGEKRR